MSLIPDIDKVIRETQQTPFSSRIANTCLRDTYKLRIPEYSGNSDPRAYIRALYLEILRAQFSPEEIEAACCQLFVENLAGPAKKWFETLDEKSIDNFDQLISAFVNQYSIFIESEVSEADLWKLSQAPNESLRSYVNRFKAIIAKIENPNEAVALLAFRNNLWYKSKFREELIVRPPKDIAKKITATLSFIANSVLKPNPSSDLEKFCEHHQIYGHSTDECRARAKELAKKQRAEEKWKNQSALINDNDKAPRKRERESESSPKNHLFHIRSDSTRPGVQRAQLTPQLNDPAVTRRPHQKDSEL
ncbi:unnamed protein product [Microthlaspi erraticum]|uniref:Retrotransposon gag domain-containing protein n=1 Tax=Microthlaspi erraticum TaxID=1685480 RepID=A0A6D2IWS5_9BRAS|nr:unnamed protein product [Microthlaspi erraticum]